MTPEEIEKRVEEIKARRDAERRIYNNKKAKRWNRANPKAHYEAVVKWQKVHREHTAFLYRKRHLRRTYGLSWQSFQAMVKSQDGKCAICGTTDPGHKSWSVDHNSEPFQVRGLLCSKCNTGIGLLKHDPEVLRSAIKYLEHHALKETQEQPSPDNLRAD